MPTISFEQFAERHGVRMTASFEARRKDSDGWGFDAWTVTLTRKGEEFTTTFRMGTGHNGKRPVIDDVIASLAMDAQSVESAWDFEDWANELGYNDDSRKAEEIYNECVFQTERVKNWLGETLFSELLECEEEGDEPTEEEIHERFERDILPLVNEQYEQDGVPDWPARREAFNDWTDSLCKDGEISEWLYEHIEHPACCGGE